MPSHYNSTQQARIQDGLCPTCGTKPDPGYRTCRYCRAAVSRRRALARLPFSGPCSCCGESNPAFLTRSGMCANCKQATRGGLTCPHSGPLQSNLEAPSESKE